MMNETQLEALRAAHGTVIHLTAPECNGAEVVARKPKRSDYLKFKALVAEPERRSGAVEALLRDCVVYPDRAGLDALLDEYPALAEMFGEHLLESVGAGAKVEAKKL